MSILSSIVELDRVYSQVGRDEFIDLFCKFIDQDRVPVGIPGKCGRGVRILDAMGARGLGFKMVFLLGMNEKSFPRFIQEEPFFRDQVRKQLRDTLGYRISEKLKAFEEERLLFHLILESSPEAVILYQRSDESGKAVSPSLYLAELSDDYSLPRPDLVLPRNWRDKFKNIYKQVGYKYLNKKENILNILLSGGVIDPEKARDLLADAEVPRLLTSRPGREQFGRLSDHDGILGEQPEWWKGEKQHGFSPKALEMYTRCPFQFFASRLLNLEYLEEPELSWMISPDLRGRLYHQILQRFYSALSGRGLPGSGVDRILDTVLTESFEEFEKDHPTGFPLIWQMKKEEISRYIQQLVEWDTARIAREKLSPKHLEADFTSTVDLDRGLGEILLRGRVDRVDERGEKRHIHLEIIDYKSRSGRPMNIKLETRMRRGISLQPAIYFLLTRDSLCDPKGGGEFSGNFSFWYITGTGEEEGPATETVSYVDFISNLDDYIEPLKYCLNSIRQGFFFINPVELYCPHCNFSTICRKFDPGVLYRLERDERAIEFRSIGK